MSFEETLIEVWRQAFAKNVKVVALGTERYRILRTSKRKLRRVDFKFDGQEIRGLEQNPDTKSWWAAMARLVNSRINLPPLEPLGFFTASAFRRGGGFGE
jgi:hypothetical protein